MRDWAWERRWTGLRVGQVRVTRWSALAVTVGLLAGGMWVALLIGPAGRHYLPHYLWAAFWSSDSRLARVAVSVYRDHGRPYRLPDALVWTHLQQTVYEGRTVADLMQLFFWVAAGGAAGTVVLLVVWAARTGHAARDGHTLRGPVLDTAGRLTARLRGDGLRIAGVHLPRSAEGAHVLILGDTGTGKSMVIRHLLTQLAARGETAVIYDPEAEFLAEFYDPQRGDRVLNPLDRRAPGWNPWDELGAPGDAEALAASLIPDPIGVTGSERFFNPAARKLLVCLLDRITSRDSYEIATWLSAPLDDVARFVAHTLAAAVVDPKAPAQAAGVLATLSLVADAFRLLPPDAATRWSARSWSQAPRGWLFLTSTEVSRDATLVLISLWLDSLVRRLLDTDLDSASDRPVWVLADELPTLQRLPSLEALLTRGRKRGLRAVIGIQGMPQLRDRYGRDTAAVLAAQPKTKVLLRSSEPETARWAADAIGQRERLVPREGVTVDPGGGRDALTVTDDRHTDHLVLPAEIMALPDLTGFLVHGGAGVARVRIDPIPRRARAPAFCPRGSAPAALGTPTAPLASPAGIPW